MSEEYSEAYYEKKKAEDAAHLRPAHYHQGGYEVFKVAAAWGFWEKAALFNVLKYIARAGLKPDESEVKDLEKARVYLDKEIEFAKARAAAKAAKAAEQLPSPVMHFS